MPELNPPHRKRRRSGRLKPRSASLNPTYEENLTYTDSNHPRPSGLNRNRGHDRPGLQVPVPKPLLGLQGRRHPECGGGDQERQQRAHRGSFVVCRRLRRRSMGRAIQILRRSERQRQHHRTKLADRLERSREPAPREPNPGDVLKPRRRRLCLAGNRGRRPAAGPRSADETLSSIENKRPFEERVRLLGRRFRLMRSARLQAKLDTRVRERKQRLKEK